MNNLTLQNFRTYKERTSIDLAPITILTGKNNAGKSTIFKSLLLLSDYLNSDNQFILEFDGPNAHKHKIDCFDNALTWASDKKSFSFKYKTNNHTFSFTFGKDDNKGVLTDFTVISVDGFYLKMKKLSTDVYNVEMDYGFIESCLITDIHEDAVLASDMIIDQLQQELTQANHFIEKLKKSDSVTEEQIHWTSKRNVISQRINKEKRFSRSIQNKKKKDLIPGESVIKFEIDLSDKKIVTSRKLISLLSNHLDKHYELPEYYKTNEKNDINQLKSHLHDFKYTLNMSMKLGSYHLGPNRTHQSRLYMNRNRDNEINEIMNFYAHNKPPVGSKKDLFLKRWLRAFDIGDEITVKDVQSTASYITIVDDGEEQNLTDKGFGAGQVLTMLMKIINVSKNPEDATPFKFWLELIQTIIIEEPETNLHPEFQSKLAEMFYDAHKTFDIRFIIETHSEYLIRKFQVLTADPEEKVETGEILLYYIYTNKDISNISTLNKVEPISILKDGRLSKPLGSGFFDESSKHAKILVKLSRNKII